MNNTYFYRKKTDTYTLAAEWQIPGRVIRFELDRVTQKAEKLRNEWAGGQHQLHHPLTQFEVRASL